MEFKDAPTTPTRIDIVDLVAKHIYSGRVLNNAHRGEVVEM